MEDGDKVMEDGDMAMEDGDMAMSTDRVMEDADETVIEREEGWQEDQLTRRIIQCIIMVHRALGPGFLEAIYHKALVKEMGKQGLNVETDKEIGIFYDGEEVGRHRLDILVEGKVIVELKAVDDLSRPHYDQVRAYLKAAGLRRGILVNFWKPLADYRRVEPV